VSGVHRIVPTFCGVSRCISIIHSEQLNFNTYNSYKGSDFKAYNKQLKKHTLVLKKHKKSIYFFKKNMTKNYHELVIKMIKES